ncbi:hypothetical protein D9M69_537280 [compost metagenome]
MPLAAGELQVAAGEGPFGALHGSLELGEVEELGAIEIQRRAGAKTLLPDLFDRLRFKPVLAGLQQCSRRLTGLYWSALVDGELSARGAAVVAGASAADEGGEHRQLATGQARGKQQVLTAVTGAAGGLQATVQLEACVLDDPLQLQTAQIDGGKRRIGTAPLAITEGGHGETFQSSQHQPVQVSALLQQPIFRKSDVGQVRHASEIILAQADTGVDGQVHTRCLLQRWGGQAALRARARWRTKCSASRATPEKRPEPQV